MPYNQSVLEEQLKKGEKLPTGLPWKLFGLSLTLFFSLIVIYLGMFFGYKPYLNSAISAAENNLAELDKSIDAEKQKQLLDIYSQSVNISNLLRSRLAFSAVFNLIEKNTYSSVRYISFKLNGDERELTLEGVAPDYDFLAKELALFENNPDVEKVVLTNSSAGDSLNKKGSSELKFSLKLVLKKEILKNIQQQ